MLQFFQTYGNLINTATILVIGGLLGRLFLARIAIMEEHVKMANMFSASKFSGELTALHELVEKDRQRQKAAAKQHESAAAQYLVLAEAILRQHPAESLKNSEHTMPLASVCGHYRVAGRSPYAADAVYIGELHVTAQGEHLRARWIAGNESVKQEYEGLGLVVGAGAAFVFPLMALGGRQEWGVVLYTLRVPGVMSGWWVGSGARGLGFEECQRVGTETGPVAELSKD
jgi:hypothetical protein